MFVCLLQRPYSTKSLYLSTAIIERLCTSPVPLTTLTGPWTKWKRPPSQYMQCHGVPILNPLFLWARDNCPLWPRCRANPNLQYRNMKCSVHVKPFYSMAQNTILYYLWNCDLVWMCIIHNAIVKAPLTDQLVAALALRNNARQRLWYMSIVY